MTQEATSPPANESASDSAQGGAAEEAQQPASSAPDNSMMEAFAAAKAERDGASTESSPDTGTTTEAEGQAPAETSEGEGEGATTETEQSQETGEAEASTPKETTLDEIEAIREKVSNGRFGELTARERSLYNAIKSDVEWRSERQEAIHNEFLRLYDLYENDQAAFLQEMDGNPKRYEAFYEYWRANPNAHEGGRPQPTEKQIRDQVRGEYSEAVKDTARQLAVDAGLSESRVAELQKEHGNRLGAFLNAAYNESVEAKVQAKLEEERPKIAAEEREAVTKELEAKYADQNKVRLPAQGTTSDPGQRETAPATNIFEAYEQAKQELGRAS